MTAALKCDTNFRDIDNLKLCMISIKNIYKKYSVFQYFHVKHCIVFILIFMNS